MLGLDKGPERARETDPRGGEQVEVTFGLSLNNEQLDVGSTCQAWDL